MKRNLQDDLDAVIYILSKGKSYNDYWHYYSFKFLNTQLHSYHAYVASLIQTLEQNKLIMTKKLSKVRYICKLETTDIPSDDWFHCYESSLEKRIASRSNKTVPIVNNISFSTSTVKHRKYSFTDTSSGKSFVMPNQFSELSVKESSLLAKQHVSYLTVRERMLQKDGR